MPQQPLVIKVLSVPELLGLIYPFLSNLDLTCCRVVSKAFSDIFTPILWHTISLITQKQHCYFTDTPGIQSALIKNAKYIRVIQAETCRVLAPFLKDDAMSLRNIHMLQLQFSVQPTLRMRTEDPSYVDAIRDIKKQEAKNLLPVKVMDWLQERDVFLWRHEIALRSLAPDQSKLQLIRETQLNSLYQVVVSVELQFADVVSSSSSIMRYLASIYKHRNFPRLKGLLDSSFFTDLQPVWDNIETRHARLNFALGESQQFRPATFIRQYMQLLLCVVDARNTRFNIDSNALVELYSDQIDDLSKQWHFILDHNLEQIHQLMSKPNTVNDSQGDENDGLIREIYFRVQEQSAASQVFLMKELGQYRLQQKMVFVIPQLNPSDEARSTCCTLENNYEPLTWDSGNLDDQELLQQFLVHAPGIRVFSSTQHRTIPDKVSKSLNAGLSELGLESLSLVYHDCPSVATTKRLSDFIKRLPQTLEILWIARFVTFDPTEEQPSTVDASGSSGDTNDDTGGDANGISGVNTSSSSLENTRIKQLLLEGNLPLHVPLSFIKRCPELRSLSITAFSDEILKIIARYIGEYCPQLEELAVDTIEDEFLVGIDVEKFDLHHLSNLLITCSNVQEWSTSDPNSSTGPLLNQEFQFHEPTPLEYIDFSFSEVSSGNWERLDVSDAASPVNSYMTWPFASTLRVLHIVIGGIIRRPIAQSSQSDIQAQDQSSTLETQAPLETQTTLGAQAISESQAILEAQKALEADASLEIQKKVCQLLGSLTLLEELALGVDEDDGPMMSAYPTWGHQRSCLELSLETGLHFMNGLKRLRIFKVTRMDHRIGLKELQWMYEPWPELKEVRGLLRSQEYAIYNLKFQDVFKEAEIVGEMLDWVREHYPQLRYT
ncbi:hypothetical protein BGZ79_000130 [Entomortierella chlamydospora]|nr:hypothetical protein BGZ79_000130 [Entomortierella chlamydospora]